MPDKNRINDVAGEMEITGQPFAAGKGDDSICESMGRGFRRSGKVSLLCEINLVSLIELHYLPRRH
jgi:hypothetical protein